MEDEREVFERLVRKHYSEDMCLSQEQDGIELEKENYLNNENIRKQIVKNICDEIDSAKDAYITELNKIDNEDSRKLISEIEKIVPEIHEFIEVKFENRAKSKYTEEYKIKGTFNALNNFTSRLDKAEQDKKKLFNLMNKVNL